MQCCEEELASCNKCLSFIGRWSFWVFNIFGRLLIGIGLLGAYKNASRELFAHVSLLILWLFVIYLLNKNSPKKILLSEPGGWWVFPHKYNITLPIIGILLTMGTGWDNAIILIVAGVLIIINGFLVAYKLWTNKKGEQNSLYKNFTSALPRPNTLNDSDDPHKQYPMGLHETSS